MQVGTGGRKHSTMPGGERRKQRGYDLRPEDQHSDRNLGPELHVPGEIVRTSTRPLKEQGGKASGPHLGTSLGPCRTPHPRDLRPGVGSFHMRVLETQASCWPPVQVVRLFIFSTLTWTQNLFPFQASPGRPPL